MNKYIFTLATFLLINLFNSYGQQMNHFGIRTGINLAKMPVKVDGENIDEDEVYARGFIFAMPFEFPVENNLSILLEPTFIQKGTAYSDKEVDGSYKRIDRDKLHINYLEVPFVFRYHQEVNKLQLFFEGGAFAGYLLSVRLKEFDKTITEDSRTVRREKTKIDIDRDEIVSLDAGILFGAGIAKSFGFGKLSLGIRYQLGLVNLEDKSSEEDDIKIFSRGINITLGISRPIAGSDSN